MMNTADFGDNALDDTRPIRYKENGLNIYTESTPPIHRAPINLNFYFTDKPSFFFRTLILPLPKQHNLYLT